MANSDSSSRRLYNMCKLKHEQANGKKNGSDAYNNPRKLINK
jgi:hypothetical protein